MILTLVSTSAIAIAQSPLIDSLQHVISQNKRDTLHAKALFNMGVTLERSDIKRSIATYQAVFELGNNPTIEKYKALAAVRLGGNYSATGELDSVDFYFGLAKNFLDTHPDDQNTAYSYFNGLGIHYGRIGEYPEALDNYKKAVDLDHQVIGQDNVAGLFLNLAKVYGQLDDRKSKVDAIYKALEIFEKTQNKTGLAFVYNALGTVYYDLKQYDESEINLIKSMGYRKSLGDKRGESLVMGNLANIYMDRGKHQLAKEYFTLAMEIQESLGLKEMVGIQLINLGKNYEKMGEYTSALQHFQKAQKILGEAGIKNHDAIILADMGKVQLLLAQEKEAYQSLMAAAQSATDQKNHSSSIAAYKNLKEYYQDQGKFQEALEAQSKEYAHRDSVGIQGLQAQLKELEARYSLDIKENEITLLKAEKELSRVDLERRKINQQLILAIFIFLILLAVVLVNKYRIVGRTKRLLEVEKLRNSLARDLHDDLGSTLSSIHILSQMALKKEDSASGKLYSKINIQTASMMDKLSDIVWSIHPNNDSFEQLLSKMQEFAGEILESKDITYSFEVAEGASDIKLDLEKKRNVFLIFKEAVNNAAKYAESKHLQIRLEVENGALSLLIRDDGKGFDMDTIKKGNGLFNMYQRAEMIGGNMVIQSFPQSGTLIQLRMPIT
ncbi:tetratricopeptide repeat protein [Belliella marina]|uniref:Tetratricopeptide repeat protein n=1 Tax=Belliella marina TaxID=1644146 RepID=A0ABW4VSU1_9BACT